MLKGRKLFSYFESFADTSSSVGSKVSLVVLFAMMSLITVDVIGRYFFDRPTYVADELSGYFLVAVTFLALGQTQKLGKHMTVTALTSHLPPRNRKWLEMATSILSLAFVVWFTWSTVLATMQAYALGTCSLGVLGTPYWIPKLLLPLGLSVFALQLATKVAKQIRSWGTYEEALKMGDQEKISPL